MKELTSRKLAGIIVSMLSIVGLVIGSQVVGEFDKDILVTSIVAISGLGGLHNVIQGKIDGV